MSVLLSRHRVGFGTSAVHFEPITLNALTRSGGIFLGFHEFPHFFQETAALLPALK